MTRQVRTDNLAVCPSSVAEAWLQFVADAVKDRWVEKNCTRCGDWFGYVHVRHMNHAGRVLCDRCARGD